MKTRTYKTTIPYTPEHLDVLRWLTRESFEVKIADDNLVLVTYDEYDVPADTIPPKTREIAAAALVEQYGVNPDDIQWRTFTAEAKLHPETERLLQAL